MEERYGFIRSEMDLKVLILFIAGRLPTGASMEELTDVTLLCDNAIGYFDFAECLGDLVRTGHLSLKDGLYSITELGRQNGAATESGLPWSVRVRAERAAGTLSAILLRNSMIETSHELRARGGVTVRLAMSDGVGPVLSMELLVGDSGQSDAIEKRFRRDAERIYGEIVGLLLKEE